MFRLIGLVTKVFKEQSASSRLDVMEDTVKQPYTHLWGTAMKPQKDKII